MRALPLATAGIALEKAVGLGSNASPVAVLPTFLVPAFQARQQRPSMHGSRPATPTPGFARSLFSSHSRSSRGARIPNHVGGQRQFSTTGPRASKLGRIPLSLPPEVQIKIGEPWVVPDMTTYMQIKKRTITIEGPIGKVSYDIPGFVTITYDEAERTASLSVEDASMKHQRAMWGTTWAYLRRHIMGVSEGHTAVLRLVGIGYRATVEPRPDKEEYPGQKFVCLKLGYTHPVELGAPQGVQASTPAPTRILLEGVNREDVMSFAGRIREWKKPEPYKGKGIFINDETIKLKQKKVK